MLMADLCYIFIIKWFLKSPACFRSRTKTIVIEVCILLNKYDEKCILFLDFWKRNI